MTLDSMLSSRRKLTSLLHFLRVEIDASPRSPNLPIIRLHVYFQLLLKNSNKIIFFCFIFSTKNMHFSLLIPCLTERFKTYSRSLDLFPQAIKESHLTRPLPHFIWPRRAALLVNYPGVVLWGNPLRESDSSPRVFLWPSCASSLPLSLSFLPHGPGPFPAPGE